MVACGFKHNRHPKYTLIIYTKLNKNKSVLKLKYNAWWVSNPCFLNTLLFYLRALKKKELHPKTQLHDWPFIFIWWICHWHTFLDLDPFMLLGPFASPCPEQSSAVDWTSCLLKTFYAKHVKWPNSAHAFAFPNVLHPIRCHAGDSSMKWKWNCFCVGQWRSSAQDHGHQQGVPQAAGGGGGAQEEAGGGRGQGGEGGAPEDQVPRPARPAAQDVPTHWGSDCLYFMPIKILLKVKTNSAKIIKDDGRDNMRGPGPDRRAQRGHARVQPLPHRQDHWRGDDASAGPPDIRQEKMVRTPLNRA